MSIRNELLDQILAAYGGASNSSDSSNQLLVKIADRIGATVRDVNIRNYLLEDILAKINE